MAFTKIVTLILGILTTKVMSMFLNLQEYGTYSQALVVIEAATALITFGLTDAVNYFYNSEKDEIKKQKYINTIFFIEMLLGIISTISICALSVPFCSYFNNSSLWLVLIILSIQPMVDNLVAMFQVLYVSNKKGKIIAIRNFIVSCLRLLVVFLGCFLLHNLYFVVIGFVITGLFQLILFWIWFKTFGFVINPFSFRRELIKPILKFGIPLGLYILVNSLLRISDKAVLGALLSTEELAIYSNAAKILPFDIISASFIVICTPFITKFISNKDTFHLSEILSGYVKISFLSTVALGAGGVLFSKDILLLLYDSKYLPGLSIFVVYMFTEMIKFCSLYIVLMSYKRNRELLIVSVVSLVLNLSLDIALYFAFGPIGCAIATLIVTFMNMFYLFVRVQQLSGIKFSKLLGFNEVAFLFLAIEGVGVVLYRLYCFLPDKILFSGFKVILFYALYCCGVFCLLLPQIKKSLYLINRSENV